MFDFIGDFFRATLYQPLFNLLFFFVSILPGESLAWAVVLLTVIIRIILIPSSAQAVRAQREVAAIQPEIEKIRKEYKDKPEELNRKLIGLYQHHNVNPLGSCLPLLVQLPILIVLYRVVIDGLSTDHFSLLYSFVHAPTSLSTHIFGINLAQPSLILALTAGIFQFIQTKQISAKTSDKDSKKTGNDIMSQMTNNLTYIMPVMTVLIAMTLPAALALYWVVTTVFSIVQQAIIIKTSPRISHQHVDIKVRRK